MLDCMIIQTDDIEPVVYDWGAVKWVANADLAPGAEQIFGNVFILPGYTSPEHSHTAEEKIVYMIQDECDVQVESSRHS